jgi:hypothetical protein
MRELLAFSCRAFPRDHRARQTDEIVDTALLAADGSAWRAARESVSLVLAGLRQRLSEESERPVRDGFALLAGVLALVNLAVALAGAAFEYTSLGLFAPSVHYYPYPYRPEWWLPSFIVVAVAIVVGLIRGDRRLALGAALANAGLIAYDPLFPRLLSVRHSLHLMFLPPGFAVRQWLAGAIVLLLATAMAPLRRLPPTRLPLAFGAALGLVVLSAGKVDFFFFRWPAAAVLVLAIAFGALVPRIAILALGVALAAVPGDSIYLAGTNLDHRPPVAGLVALGLAVGLSMPFARVVRRRLT